MEERTSSQEIRDILLAGFAGICLSVLPLFFGFLFLFLFLPLPYVIVINKHGHRAGTFAVGLTAVVNLFLIGYMGLVLTLITFGLVGIVVGGAFHEKIRPNRIMLLSILTCVGCGLVTYYLSPVLGFPLNDLFRESIQQNFDLLQSMTDNSLAAEYRDLYVEVFILILPGLIAGFLSIYGILNYYISAYFLQKLKFQIEHIKPFKLWRFPRYISFLFIIFVILPKDPISINLSVVMIFVLLIEGFALMDYYGDKWGIPSWIRNIIIVVAFLILNIFISFLGLVDNLIDLRRIRKHEKEKI